MSLEFGTGKTGFVDQPEGEPPVALQRACSADGVENSEAALKTYRRIWERLPERQRHDIMASMRCWSPLDYEVMVAEEKRQNE